MELTRRVIGQDIKGDIMTEQQILDTILDHIKKTGPIGNLNKAKALASKLADMITPEPELSPIRKIKPPMGGFFDKSPAVDNSKNEDTD